MSLKEWIVGSHKCNQHHTHRSMEEVNQCNELAKQESKNKTDIALANIRLEGMDRCIQAEEKRTERLQHVGGCLNELRNMQLDLTRPEHLALLNRILTEDSISSNMRSLEPANN